MHGLPEIVVAAILVVVLCKGMERVRTLQGNPIEDSKEDM
jgi:hypothetical protein